mgnify:CR=1 FL=1
MQRVDWSGDVVRRWGDGVRYWRGKQQRKQCDQNAIEHGVVELFFLQAEGGIRAAQESRGLGDVYKRQHIPLGV